MRSFVLVALVVPLAGCAVRVPQARDCDPRSAARPVCGLQNPEDVVAIYRRNDPATPATTTGMPDAKWSLGGSRSHP